MATGGRKALFASSLAIVSLVALLVGCSKEDAKPVHRVQTLGDPRTVAPTPPPAPPTDDDNAPSTPEPAPHALIGPTDAGPLYYTVKIKRDANAPSVDPDLAVMAEGRVLGARCFTGITDGSRSRSATIQVTVLPSGSVSRSEVSSGSTHEAWILSCLEGVGNGLHFADKPAADIRTYSIGVTVTRGH